MGYGDQLMATGMARGAQARGKRIAFGEYGQIKWDHYSETVFKNNPNIAPPGSERDQDLEWIRFFRGHRIYNKHDTVNNRWIWNYKFRVKPGEIFLTPEEIKAAPLEPYVLVEPYASIGKIYASNKQWPISYYIKLIQRLGKVCQVLYKGPALPGVRPIQVKNFREAAAVVSRAKMYIGSEGGLHHTAAAFGVPAVVIFGGWIPPSITGYDFHVNIARGKACGHIAPCPHCQQVLQSISVDEVYEAIQGVQHGMVTAGESRSCAN
jgi:ADP-heptose:LPS heptosyltransferase